MDPIIEKYYEEIRQREERAKSAGVKLGSYDSYALSFDKYGKNPLLSSAINKILDRPEKAECERFIKDACDRAKNGFDAGDETELFDVYDGVERALYLSENPEDRVLAAAIMYIIRTRMSEEADLISGEIGVTAWCMEDYCDNYLEDDIDFAKEAYELTKQLREYIFKLIKCVDSAKNGLTDEAYKELSKYYERLVFPLGKVEQWFKYSAMGVDPSDVHIFNEDDAEKAWKKTYDVFAFNKEVESGKYTPWQLECLAETGAKQIGKCPDNDKIDMAERLMIADGKRQHYICKEADEVDKLLKKSGAVNSNGEAEGKFLGTLGRKISKLKNEEENKTVKPQVKFYYRGIVAILLCIGFIAFVWLNDSSTVGWLGSTDITKTCVIIAVAAVTGFVASGFGYAASEAVFAFIIFIGRIFLSDLIGLDTLTEDRVVATLTMVVCIIGYFNLISENSPKALTKYNVEREDKIKKMNAEITEAEHYASKLADISEAIGQWNIAVYYSAAYQELHKIKTDLIKE